MPNPENSSSVPTILIVEDDAALSQTIADTLEASRLNEGFQVATAESVQETEDFLRQSRSADLSLLILDVGLPDGSGESILTKIRSDPRYRETGIIVTSGFPIENASEKYQKLGADIFIPKPWELLKFTSAISQFTKRQP